MENSSKVVARLPKKKFLTKERLFILCSLAPTLIMLSGWTFYPTLHSFVLSFFDTTMDSLGEFEGLRNYVAVLTNETFWVPCETPPCSRWSRLPAPSPAGCFWPCC